MSRGAEPKSARAPGARCLAGWGGFARGAQRGVTLVEVLVSMLIMALGMVSLAALQGYTLRYQMGSAQRAQLSGLLSDYAERVRANVLAAPGLPGASANSPYLITDTWATQATEATPAVNKDCGSASSTCSADELAAYDMAQWRAAVRRELPRGAVRVAGSALTGLTVTFMWSDKDFGDGGSSAFTARTSPTCNATAMSGAALQTCCPADALGSGTNAGVRCANFTVIP